MKKQIDFPPYTQAHIKEINPDGSILCDLYGEGISDTNIGFPPGNPYLKLTDEDVEQFNTEKQQQEEEIGG